MTLSLLAALVDMPAARSPRILVMENRPALGPLLIRALEWDGYGVVWVNGESGLRAAKRWGRPFDLVITNSPRCGMAGVDLIAQIHTLFPGLPVLHLNDLSQIRVESLRNPTTFKPFRLDSLSEAVRSLLADRTGQH